MPWRTRLPLVSSQACEASLSLKANRAWRTRRAPHARRTLFSSLAWQSWRTRQAWAPNASGISLVVVTPGLLGSWAFQRQKALGAVVEAWHTRDALVSLLSLLHEVCWVDPLPLDTVPTDTLKEVLFNW